MATTAPLAAGQAADVPQIRTLTLHDVMDALAKGIADARDKPSHIPFVIGIYTMVMLLGFLVVFNYEYLPWVFPAVSGAVLIGPFVTLALCEVSRRRERGLDYSGLQGYDFWHGPSFGDIVLLGLMLIALYFFWLTSAMTLYGMTLGDPWRSVPKSPDSVIEFARLVFGTSAGWTLIVLGNLVGAFFAVAGLMLGAVSFPLLLDRPVGIGVAVQTSIRVVIANPVMMGVWGLIVVVMLLAGAIPLLAGLAFTIPVLGHATWHLYRKVVV